LIKVYAQYVEGSGTRRSINFIKPVSVAVQVIIHLE